MLVIAVLFVAAPAGSDTAHAQQPYVDLVLTNHYGTGIWDPATRTTDDGDVIFVVHNHGTAEAKGVIVSFLLDKLQADYGYNTPPPSSVTDVKKADGQESFTWFVGNIPAGGSGSESLSFGTRRNSGIPEPSDTTPYTVGSIRAEAASQNVEPSGLRKNNVRKVYQLFVESRENYHISVSRLGLSVSVDDLRPNSGSPDVDFDLNAYIIDPDTYVIHPETGDCITSRCQGAFTDIEISVELQGLKFKDGWTPPAEFTKLSSQSATWNPETVSAISVLGELAAIFRQDIAIETSLTGDSLQALPLDERCITARVVDSIPPPEPGFALGSLTQCLGDDPPVLFKQGTLQAFTPYPCVDASGTAITSYPCDASGSTSEVAVIAVADSDEQNPNLRSQGVGRSSYGKVMLLPDQGNITIQVKDPFARVVSGGTVTWQTGREARTGVKAVPGVIVGFTDKYFLDRTRGKQCPGTTTCRWWSLARTMQVRGLNQGSSPPGGVKIKNAANEYQLYDANSGNSYTSTRPAYIVGAYARDWDHSYVLEFSTLGTHVIDYTAGVTRRSDSALQEDTGSYIFHVGPIAELEASGQWDAVDDEQVAFIVSALNHGPDHAPDARLSLNLPIGVTVGMVVPSQGTYRNGVWYIGELIPKEHRQALGQPEAATLKVFATVAGGVSEPIRGNLANHQDYHVCIDSSGGDIDAASRQACEGNSGASWYSTHYYDYIPGNNDVRLNMGRITPTSGSATRVTGMAITSPAGSYLPGQDLEVEATFSDTVTADVSAKLRLQVGPYVREAKAVPSTGKAVRFRYRVQWADRTDPGKPIRVPVDPFPYSGAIKATGGKTLSLLFPGQDLGFGHAIGPQPDRVWDMDAGAYVNVPEWSDPVFLTAGQEGSRYRFMDGMRHYYVYDSLTRRWMLEFRIDGPRLSADDLDLIQWLYLRGSGYYADNQGHPYGNDADPVEGRPYLGRWDDLDHRGNQACWGLEAMFSPGKTRGQRLQELANIAVDRFGRVAFARYGISQPGYVDGLLSSAKSIAPETCPAASDRLRASPPPGAFIVGMEMNSIGPYQAGDAIAVAVIFDREVDVSGAPQLAIEVGGSARTAVYDAALSSPRSKVFRYTARETDRDGDGVGVYPGSIVLPEGASIRDPGGIPARLEHNGLAAQTGHTVGPQTSQSVRTRTEGVAAPPPVVTGLALRGSGPHGEGDAVSVAVTFDWDVTVVGTPTLNIEVGGSSRAAVYQPSLSEAAVKVFSYTVREDDRDTDGVSVYPSSITLPEGASIRDDLDTDADLMVAGLPPQPDHTVDGSQEGQSNSEPQFAAESATLSVDEDAAIAANVGDAITATDADGDTLTYALSGSDAFAIDAGTGQITVQAALDYETQSSYSLTVTVTDGKDASGEADSTVDDTIVVTVSVGNVDEPETAPTVPADWTLIPEGIGPGDSFRLLFVTSGTTKATSTDIADYNAFVRTAAGNNADLKQFEDGFTALISTSAVDARTNTGTTGEGVPIHWLGGAQVADDYTDLYDGDWDSVSGKTEGDGDYTGLVWTGGNRAGGKSGQSYAGAAEVRLGDLSDATLALSSPAARAASQAFPLYAVSPVITVAAEAGQQQVSNSEPQFTLESDSRSVDENAATGSNVGSPVTATDADGDALTYALTGSGAFAIDGSTGQITVREALDYETQSSYALTVTVTDGRDVSGGADSGVDDSIAVTVSVGNVDEAGAVTFDSDPPRAGSPLTANLSDPDEGVSGLTWAWQVSADGTSWAAIDGASGASYTPSAGDVGSYLRATASYSDGHGSGKSAAAATTGAVETAQDTTAPTVVSGPVIVSDPDAEGPDDDTYGRDDVIAVSVTFSEAVAVIGKPRIRLKVGDRNRWAVYDCSEAGGTRLVFVYTVRGSDRDEDGVSIEADQLGLNRGSITDADGNAAGLEHPALAAQSGHKVDGSPEQAALTLPADSPLVPAGLGPGDSFRLLFVTSTTTKAESSDIDDYNGFVQALASANASLASFSGQFTALISTATVDARENTGTTGRGVPIYWLGGEKVADGYADLYDGDWDSVSGMTEGGGSYTGLVWTGGNKTGEKSEQKYAGATEVRMGDLGDATMPLSSPTGKAATESYPLYALSPVIAVAQPE